jgi:hypothetical protein
VARTWSTAALSAAATWSINAASGGRGDGGVFSASRALLRVVQPLAPCGGTQTIGRADEMNEVKADRRRPAGRHPDVILAEPVERMFDVFDRLQKRVCGRLQRRGHTGHGPFQPQFRLMTHGESSLHNHQSALD